MKFGFDLALNRSRSSEEYASLGSRGFTLFPITKEHPGKTLCRFIHFRNAEPTSHVAQVQIQYLEFVEMLDPDKSREHYESFGANGSEYLSSVYYLSCSQSLNSLFKKKKQEFENYGISFLHKNYNWQTDQSPFSPGWNFLFFREELIRGIHCSIAEYEFDGSKPGKPDFQYCDHPNTAHKILGVYWQLIDNQDVNSFLELTDLSQHEGEIKLHDRTCVWTTGFQDHVKQSFRKKRTSFCAVIIGCLNFSIYKKILMRKKTEIC